MPSPIAAPPHLPVAKQKSGKGPRTKRAAVRLRERLEAERLESQR